MLSNGVMALATVGVYLSMPTASSGGSFWLFLAMFQLIFFAAGVGNGSSFQLAPKVFLLQAGQQAKAAGLNVAEAYARGGRRGASAMNVSSVMAFGGFVIPKSFGSALAAFGSFLPAFGMFFVLSGVHAGGLVAIQPARRPDALLRRGMRARPGGLGPCWRPCCCTRCSCFAGGRSHRAPVSQAVLTLSLPAPPAAGVPDGAGRKQPKRRRSSAVNLHSPSPFPLPRRLRGRRHRPRLRRSSAHRCRRWSEAAPASGKESRPARRRRKALPERQGQADRIAWRCTGPNICAIRSRNTGALAGKWRRGHGDAAGRGQRRRPRQRSDGGGQQRLSAAGPGGQGRGGGWRFVPAKRNGQPVDSVLTVPVRFERR